MGFGGIGGGNDFSKAVDAGLVSSTLFNIINTAKKTGSKYKLTDGQNNFIGLSVVHSGYPMCNTAVFIDRYPDNSFVDISYNPEGDSQSVSGTAVIHSVQIRNMVSSYIEQEDKIIQRINNAAKQGIQLNPSSEAMQPVDFGGVKITPVLKKVAGRVGVQFLYEVSPTITIKVKSDQDF